MGKMILGIIVGFVVWTILWLGSNAILVAIMPDIAPTAELTNITSTYLIIRLISSVIFSIIAGFVAVIISKEAAKTAFFLGMLLLATGIFVQVGVWNAIPLWYHIIFLILLIPMTLLGGKLKKAEAK